VAGGERLSAARTLIVGKRIAAVTAGILIAGTLAAALGLKCDLLLHGVVCLQRARTPDGEGIARVSCADGRVWRVAAQLPCSETLACTIGLDCIDSVEPMR
jgi:hypothetical protein